MKKTTVHKLVQSEKATSLCGAASCGASTMLLLPHVRGVPLPQSSSVLRSAELALGVVPSVELRRGMPLDEIVGALEERNASVCVQPHESYSFGGLSNTWLLHQSVANYALEHAPALSWRFGQFGSKDDLGQHDNSAFQDLLFSTERDGPGRRCRRDGLDGDVSRRFCLHCPGASGRGTRGCAVGQMVLGEPPKDGLLQDGDTLTAGGCSGQEGRAAALSTNFSLTRPLLAAAYWAKHPPVPAAVAAAHAAGELAVAVHMRNGDLTREKTNKKTGKVWQREEHHAADVRYVPANAYKSNLQMVAELPAGCARVYIVTENGDDAEVRKLASWFEKKAEKRVPLEVLDDPYDLTLHKGPGRGSTHTGSCSPDCALHMFTQSDVLVMGRSGFPIFAAAMRNETMMLPVKCHEGGSGDASFGHTLDTAGGFIADSDALEADLRRRLPERCLKSHVTPSQLVSFAAEELR